MGTLRTAHDHTCIHACVCFVSVFVFVSLCEHVNLMGAKHCRFIKMFVRQWWSLFRNHNVESWINSFFNYSCTLTVVNKIRDRKYVKVYPLNLTYNWRVLIEHTMCHVMCYVMGSCVSNNQPHTVNLTRK